MTTITLLPTDVTVGIAPGTTILEALRANAVAFDAPCNGLGTCGKCKVRVGATRATAATAPEVLACEVKVEHDLVVILPEHSGQDRVLLTGTRGQRPLKPWVTRAPGGTTPLLGAAVDIGTTTLVVSLLDLETGQELATLGSLNPQTRYGHDVLSRIQHASSPEGLEELRRAIVDELNRLLSKTAKRSGTQAGSIAEVCLSGNTTMLHLVTGTNPESLGRYPYVPRIGGHSSHPAQSIGLHAAPEGSVYLPPIFDGFVGADISSGVLATELHRGVGATLFIDIGTNGEMVLAVDGQLTATSTAAGPAFEGMNITCGMRATDGAIERVAIDASGDVQIKSIGGLEPVGLCGSGLIEAVGQLVMHGIVGVTGRFVKPASIANGKLRDRMVAHDGKPAFRIAGNVVLTQGDIRQVQLAKGALRSGIDQMLLSQGLTPCDVERVLVAGSFGAHLTIDSLVTIGILPNEFADRVEMVGNTSRTGAEAFLLDVDAREELATVIRRATTLDLAHAPDFEKRFVSCLAFPSAPRSIAA